MINFTNSIKKIVPSYTQYDIEYIKPLQKKDKLRVAIIGVDKPQSSSVFFQKGMEALEEVSEVILYDYRDSLEDRYNTIIKDFDNLSKHVDIMFIMKGNGIPLEAVKQARNNCRVHHFMMDIYRHFKQHGGMLDMSTLCHTRSATGYGVAVAWANKIKLPVYHIIDGSDPITYYPYSTEKLYDVSFIGAKDNERENIYRSLHNAGINVKFFGPNFTDFVLPDEFRTICNQSKTVLNISRTSTPGYSSLRLWNLLACGSMVLTKYIPYMQRSLGLILGKHIEDFKDNDELVLKVRYTLDHNDIIERIGNDAREYVLNNRTWAHTAKELIYIIKNDYGTKVNFKFKPTSRKIDKQLPKTKVPKIIDFIGTSRKVEF